MARRLGRSLPTFTEIPEMFTLKVPDISAANLNVHVRLLNEVGLHLLCNLISDGDVWHSPNVHLGSTRTVKRISDCV